MTPIRGPRGVRGTVSPNCAAIRMAAAACLQNLALPVADISSERRRLARLDRFARGVAAAFPWPTEAAIGLPDDTVVCRCEGVTAGEPRRTQATVSSVRAGAETPRSSRATSARRSILPLTFCGIVSSRWIAEGIM